jgi:hypothetical protein
MCSLEVVFATSVFETVAVPPVRRWQNPKRAIISALAVNDVFGDVP